MILETGLLRGMIVAEPQKSSTSEILKIEGVNEMKYQGISIIQHKTCSTWYARYRKNGKQFYVSAKTQKECYEKLKIALKKEPEKAKKKTPVQKLTFYAWFEKWLELFKSDVKENTKMDYFKSMKYLSRLYKKPLGDIKSLEIVEILNTIKFERRKQIVYDLLSSLFLKAFQNELIAKNPMLTLEKPKHTKQNGLALSNIDERSVEKYLLENNMDFFLVCLYQGLRHGECAALTISDFDFKNKTLKIDKAINQFNELDKTKNKQSVRTMPLFEKTIEVVKKYLNVPGRIFDLHYGAYQKQWKRIISETTPNKRYTIHSLRHTFVTRCQEAGVPLHIIQKWVGHATGSSVTTRVYTHSREQEEMKNIDKINEKLNSN